MSRFYPYSMDQNTLKNLWDRVFLNYRPEAPDHWTVPEYPDFFDDPIVAVPILQKLSDRDSQQGYVEYFAAVWREHFAKKPESLNAMLPLLKQAQNEWTERKDDLDRLVHAVEETLRDHNSNA